MLLSLPGYSLTVKVKYVDGTVSNVIGANIQE